MAVRVVDPETLEPLPAGQSGLLLVKGPNVMVGYLGDLEQTEKVLKEGYYSTGDIGCMDADGFVTITDRLNACPACVVWRWIIGGCAAFWIGVYLIVRFAA